MPVRSAFHSLFLHIADIVHLRLLSPCLEDLSPAMLRDMGLCPFVRRPQRSFFRELWLPNGFR